MQSLEQKIQNSPSCKVIFTDFYDTLIHREVHPNYCIKLWSKFLIRELGASITVDQLFSIRLDALAYLAKEQKKRILEVPYESLIKEVYKRLVNSDALINISFQNFKEIFEHADYISEVSVQFKNDKLINSLAALKKEGYSIYLVTDFFLSKAVMEMILSFHNILSLFDEVFVSCEVMESKEGGAIYPLLLNKIKITPEEVIMIGDNLKSDIVNSAKHGIKSIHTKHKSHHRRNKRNLFGNDSKDFKKACTEIERRCRKSGYQFSEYIIHFYFFTERLYAKMRKDGVKDLFFLAREGLYLKRLFDFYQELNQFEEKYKINTHYFKASRQSARLINLKPLNDGKFDHFSGIQGQMSTNQMMQWFRFSPKSITEITKELSNNLDEVHENIFESEVFEKLRANSVFQEHYEANRMLQKETFSKYIEHFNAPIKEEGMALVDVGWGGTMQECIYDFFDHEVPVTGYYIGLKAIYNIQENTKRYGLNFGLYPNRDLSYEILKANGQLYEQLLGAPHGSTLAYTFDSNDVPTTVEFHEENEKMVFDTYIKDIQAYMLVEFKNLFLSLRKVNYTQENAQDYMTDLALRIGIISTKKKIKFINKISEGFYQNVGENKVGLAYSPNQLKSQKRSLLKLFLRSPEKVFRFIVKLKPFLLAKGMYWLSPIVNLAYYYTKFNFWIKKKLLSKRLLD